MAKCPCPKYQPNELEAAEGNSAIVNLVICACWFPLVPCQPTCCFVFLMSLSTLFPQVLFNKIRV